MLAISVAALGMTAAALLSSPRDEAAASAAGSALAAGRPEAPRSSVPKGGIAPRKPVPEALCAGRLPAAPANPMRPHAPAAAPSGQRCAARFHGPPACEAPAAHGRRLPG
ncbi:MAG TPA: hypothetical protein VHG32_27025 [Thermoanaerobaculia bacterium]|nr:hypothetical protein [Thermoanaerobaculia bacterium]